MRSSFLAAVALLGVLWVGSASAGQGDFALLRLGGQLVKWGEPRLGTGATVTYALAGSRMEFPGARNCETVQPLAPSLTASGIDPNGFRAELTAAFQAWSAVADIHFTEAAETSGADIIIGAEASPTGWAFTNVRQELRPEEQVGGAVRALGRLPATSSAPAPRGRQDVSPILQSLICLNPVKRWKIGFDGNLSVYDLRYTLMHEIGHAIGLDHPDTAQELMSFRYAESGRNLRPGDVQGAVALYGPAHLLATP